MATRAVTMDEARDMSEQKNNQATPAGTSPADDVATLYSWANLHGAKYRDFTASRQELRAQARLRAAEAATERRSATMEAMPAPIVDENIRVGGRQESEQPEMAEQVHTVPGEIAPEAVAQDYRRGGFEETAGEILHLDNAPIMPAWLEQASVAQPIPIRTEAIPQPESGPMMLAPAVPETPMQMPQATASLPAAPPMPQVAMQPMTPMPPAIPSRTEYAQPSPELHIGAEPRGVGERYEYRPSMQEAARSYPQPPMRVPEPQYRQQPESPQAMGRSEMRWSALQNLFDGASRDEPVESSVPELRAPVVALFSVAGGVGKTSLTASVGRALAAYGERTLLTETSAFGTLPFYFGAQNSRPGVLRTFASNSQNEAPVQVISIDGDHYIEQGNQTAWLYDELLRSGREASRIVVDVTGGLLGSIRQVLRLNPVVVVPVLPDMSSAVALQSVDRFFRSQRDGHGRVVEPYFLLNEFDASVPLHRDVRDMLLQKYGDRLLPFVIHRSPAVSEALAEGLTVIDYAPGSEVANDILHFAGWVRSLANAGAAAYRGVRWSER